MECYDCCFSSFFFYLASSLMYIYYLEVVFIMTSTNNRDKVKTYLLAASGRRTIRNTPWIDDVPSESFTLPKYEVSQFRISMKMKTQIGFPFRSKFLIKSNVKIQLCVCIVIHQKIFLLLLLYANIPMVFNEVLIRKVVNVLSVFQWV